MIVTLVGNAVGDQLTDPPTINEQFSSGSGVFTLSGGASVSGGNLNLLTTNDRALKIYPAFRRGFYVEASVDMRGNFDFSYLLFSIDDGAGAGYSIVDYCDPFENIGVLAVHRGREGGTPLIQVVNGSSYTDPLQTIRMEVNLGGSIVLKRNGVTIGSATDTVHSEFTYVDLRFIDGGGGYVNFFRMGEL